MYTLNENINTQSHIEDIEDLEVSISSSWYQIYDYATKVCVQIVCTSKMAKQNLTWFTYLLLNSHWFLIECHDIPRPIFKANNKHSFVFLESLSILQYIFVLQAIHAPLFILYLSRLSLSLSPLSSFESYFLHSKHNNASSFRTFSTPIHRRDSMKTEWARSYRCFHYTF